MQFQFSILILIQSTFSYRNTEEACSSYQSSFSEGNFSQFIEVKCEILSDSDTSDDLATPTPLQPRKDCFNNRQSMYKEKWHIFPAEDTFFSRQLQGS